MIPSMSSRSIDISGNSADAKTAIIQIDNNFEFIETIGQPILNLIVS